MKMIMVPTHYLHYHGAWVDSLGPSYVRKKVLSETETTYKIRCYDLVQYPSEGEKMRLLLQKTKEGKWVWLKKRSVEVPKSICPPCGAACIGRVLFYST